MAKIELDAGKFEDAQNPLLMKLPPERSFMGWLHELGADPRDRWPKPYPDPLESRVDQILDLYVVTEMGTKIAVALDSMLRASLRRRDPRILAVKRRIWERTAVADAPEISEALKGVPRHSIGAIGALVQGPTGTSKSHSVEDYLARISQVIMHGPNEECGWSSLKQLVYLRVELPNTAVQTDLYHGIAGAMDKELGTDYLASLKKEKPGSKLQVLLGWLDLHKCGLLILEEVQEKNTGPVVLGKEFAGAFLKITNHGIPLVLIGNPLAFTHIKDFTQDVGRLTLGGQFDCNAAFDHLDEAWTKDLVPGIWGWTCFNELDEEVEDLPELLFERTGGVPKFLTVYRRATLKEALRQGASRVERPHMDAAYFSEEMIALHAIIDAYVSKTDAAFQGMRDQPLLYMKEFWAREKKKRSWMKAERIKAKAAQAKKPAAGAGAQAA
jgi:hypothetical protein